MKDGLGKGDFDTGDADTGGPDMDVLADRLAAIAAEAGRFLRSVEDRRAGTRRKSDGTSATNADRDAEALILSRLAGTLPAVPVVAEESCVQHGDADLFLLVDPLDGTSDFLAGGHEWSVNIALVRGSRPVAAALAAPGLHLVWAAGTTARVATLDASASGFGPWRPVRTRAAPASGLVVLGSRRHGDPETERCLSRLPVAATRTASSAAKFGLVASGDADLYVRCGPTMEWDTAAGDHIVTRAGGAVFGPDRHPLRYGRGRDGYRNGPFAVAGDPALRNLVTLPVRTAAAEATARND